MFEANSTQRKLAPPKSFINILDYPDMKSLTEYLKYLDNNDTAYNKYHAWRKDYKIKPFDRCHLCLQMHEKHVKEKKRTSDKTIGEILDREKLHRL